MSSSTEAYKRAAAATELIEPPANGFVKPAELSGSASFYKTCTKQNNFIIELLCQQAEQIRLLKEELQVLKDEVKDKKGKAPITEELVSRLENLQIGEVKGPAPEPRGKLRVFKDPSKFIKK